MSLIHKEDYYLYCQNVVVVVVRVALVVTIQPYLWMILIVSGFNYFGRESCRYHAGPGTASYSEILSEGIQFYFLKNSTFASIAEFWILILLYAIASSYVRKNDFFLNHYSIFKADKILQY